ARLLTSIGRWVADGTNTSRAVGTVSSPQIGENFWPRDGAPVRWRGSGDVRFWPVCDVRQCSLLRNPRRARAARTRSRAWPATAHAHSPGFGAQPRAGMWNGVRSRAFLAPDQVGGKWL